jgi:poly(hydroxyalkanoate) depolymerase family esterase
MNAVPKIDMMEAMRLMREGRLGDALAALRGTRHGAVRSDYEADTRQCPSGRTPATLNMTPPSKQNGSSWTFPQFREAPSTSRTSSFTRPIFSEALRGFLDHAGQLGPSPHRGVGPARAPVSLPDGGYFQERTYANAAGTRTYKLYVPSRYSGQPLPLVVMLHGCAQSPDDFAAGTRMNDLAEEQNFLVAYPSQSQSANVSKCWNWFNPAHQQRAQGEPSLIAGITRQIVHEFPVEPARIYIAGLSAGGAAAAIMGSTYPDVYAAVGIHSGLACGAASDMSSAFTAMRHGSVGQWGSRQRSEFEGAVPTIVFHGDCDQMVNPVNSDQIIARLKAATNLQTTVSRSEAPGRISYTRIIHAEESGRPILEQWVLHGAGHAWSGGSSAGTYTEPRGPDASREMIRFFSQQPARTPGADNGDA